MSSDELSGMSGNERLYTLGLIEEFYQAVDRGDLKRVHEILDAIKMPESKQLWPKAHGTDAIARRLAGASTQDEKDRRDQLIADYEGARAKSDLATMHSILKSLGLKESSLEWPVDARDPSI